MSAKAAEQLVETVRQARSIIQQLPSLPNPSFETKDPNERTIRLYIQSNLPDKVLHAVKQYKSSPEFKQIVLDRCLYFAAYYGFVKVVKAILESGANLTYRSTTGVTPLIKAVGSRNTETVRLLLGAKADMNETTNSGLSALAIAESIRDDDMVEVLRNYQGA